MQQEIVETESVASTLGDIFFDFHVATPNKDRHVTLMFIYCPSHPRQIYKYRLHNLEIPLRGEGRVICTVRNAI